MTFREAGVFGFLQLGHFFAGGLWALVCAVLLAMRKRVPPVIAIAPLLVAPLLATIGAMVADSQISAALVNADPAQRATLMAAGMAETLAQGWFALLAVPIAMLLGVAGLSAGVRAPRAWGVPVLVFLVATFTAVLPVAGLFYGASPPSVLARVMLYGLGAVPLALATVCAHPKGNGPEGGMVAASAWVSVIAASELAALSSGWSAGFRALAYADAEQKATLLGHLSTEMGGQATLAWVIFALSAVPALVCAMRSGPEPTEEEIMAGEASPSPWRSVGRFVALAVWPAWAFAFLSLDPSAAIAALTPATAG